MLRALCLAVAIFVLPLPHASADTPADAGANAALKYWQAFATLPKLTDADGQKLGAEYLTMPLDAHAREIVNQAEYSLLMMHHGAALPRCDWGIGPEEGIYVRFPNGAAARVLSTLAALRARIRFEEGRNGEAIDDIVAGLTLGRHSTLAGTNIMLLVGYAIEHHLTETLARYLPKLDGKTLMELKSRLAALPPGVNTATALGSEEKFYLDWFVRKVKEAKDTESLVTTLAFVNIPPEGKAAAARDQARALVEDCGGTVEGVRKFAEETRPSYRLMAEKLKLPLDEFEKEFDREHSKQAGNPVFKIFFPAIVNVRRAEARLEIRRALLAAAIAVQVDGRDVLKNHLDPVSGGPFEYEVAEGGFELRSKLKSRDDKPVALIVGQRGK